ncbi:MAG: hypothetical protein LBF92_04270 [Synergistaceae bacterium]|jgi:uncharacterized protein YdeI (BOF family)|nr:hypothetical protein [Synergistaceae bacterium]
MKKSLQAGIKTLQRRALVAALAFVVAAVLPLLSEAAIKSKLNTPAGSGGSPSPAAGASAQKPALPKKGDIVVVVDGSDDQHRSIVESVIVQELVNHGYRVVDEKKMKQIRQSAAARKAVQLALAGDMAGLAKLSGSYNASAAIALRVEAGSPRENEFGLLTGTASVTYVVKISGGSQSTGANSASAKKVGYTEEEAARLAVEEAARLVSEKLL